MNDSGAARRLRRNAAATLPIGTSPLSGSVGSGDLWVSECIITYDGVPTYSVSIMEFAHEHVVHETQYFADPFSAPAWRAALAEPMPGRTAPVAVAVTTSRTEAELIVGLLHSYGLHAAVSADDAGGQEPQLQLQGVRVLVAPSDETAARHILAGSAHPGADPNPLPAGSRSDRCLPRPLTRGAVVPSADHRRVR